MHKQLSMMIFLFLLLAVVWADQNDTVMEKGQLLPAYKVPLCKNVHASRDVTPVMQQNFESGATGWTMDGLWQIGMPSTGPNGGHNSPNCVATNLGGSYANSANYWLISPELAIGAASHVRLRFWEWFQMESGWDYGKVKVTTNNGASWTEVHSSNGNSDWRETTINLSSYQNSTVQIAFNFTSDGSITYLGWYVDDVVLELEPMEPLSITLTNLNAQSFPHIYANVEVDSMGVGISSLMQSNFVVRENGILQTDYFEVTPPDEGAGSRLADIVFVLDVTGSMGEEINAARANMLNFVNAIADSDIQYGIGFVVFGDIVYTYNSGQFYYQLADILSVINNIQLGEHGIGTGGDNPENQLGAMATAALMNYRPGAQRVQIMLTDATAHENDGVTPWSVDALISDMLVPSNITVFPIFNTGSGDQQQQYIPIADATNGAYYNIFDDFSSIVNEISSQVSNSYLVRYRTNHPQFDGVLRNVDITVSYLGNQDTASGSYMPGSAPQVTRTQGTLDLHLQPWAEGTAFTISAHITDTMAPLVQEARVFYRKSSTTSYQSVQMSQAGASDIWSAMIPTNAVQTPGLDYYITATDGQTTSSTPTVEPATYPWQLAILPNVAPVITHTPISTLTLNQAVPVFANVIDVTNSLASVTLCYRKTGQLIYQSTAMNSLGNSDYQATIPASYATIDGVDYYLKAADNFNVNTYHGTADSPHRIVVPGSTFVIRDSSGNLIPNTVFEIYKVDRSNPSLEYSKEDRETDINGEFSVPGNWFNPGDWVKVKREVYEENTTLPNHEVVGGRLYSVTLDNAVFVSNGEVSYPEYVAGSTITIPMGHTTVKYNLRVSVEWAADQAYLDNLANGFRLVSNYLYDVFDGQVHLDRVVIYNNKEHWDDCDVRIHASNVQWPQARVNGISSSNGIFSSKGFLFMPRVFYLNNLNVQRNLTDAYPYDWTIANVWGRLYPPSRTLAHEFGHYGIGFYDEYINNNDEYVFPNNNETQAVYHFGMMDDQLINDPQNSEMSCNTIHYADTDHRVTMQWARRGNSCWNYFDQLIGNLDTEIVSPIIRPDEREPIDEMYSGPNDNMTNLTVNVGSHPHTTVQIINNATPSDTLRLRVMNGSNHAVPTASVLLTNLPAKNIVQGRPSDSGGIIILGGEDGDTVTAMDLNSGYIGRYEIGSSTGDAFEIVEIDDIFQGVINHWIWPDENEIQIDFQTMPAQAPRLEIWGANSLIFNEQFEEESSTVYSVTYNRNLLSDDVEELIMIVLEDSKAGPLRLMLSAKNTQIEAEDRRAFSDDGQFEVTFGNNDINAIDTALVSSMALPPLREGLIPEAEQAGNCYSLSTSPSVTTFDDTNVKLYYDDISITLLPEYGIRIHLWDDLAGEWKVISSEVDTLNNVVSGEISKPGLYAAFTTKVSPGTHGSLENKNIYFFPNPFNPNREEGKVRYSLASNGMVTLNIYDISGRLVTTLLDGVAQEAGVEQTISWNGTNDKRDVVANGVYFYVIESSSGERAVGKAAVLK
ncbi:MAG TPA: choice-of-anchor J domain-containing protein [Candidatus Cloacimonadota bacterium]|nr:choice-of-anchor J domain-containing protein [Candidatus Cloacimonadota bacterium]